MSDRSGKPGGSRRRAGEWGPLREDRSGKPGGSRRRAGNGGRCVMATESPEGAGGERGLVADGPTRPEGGARPAPLPPLSSPRSPPPSSPLFPLYALLPSFLVV
ncbi:MAG: hypothetical protein LBU37_06735 [Tannerellaceae bacterium]|nr:hypothetical protein [Tannerellaceae bacterium]